MRLKKKYPDPTSPRQEMLPDEDITTHELTTFFQLAEDCMPLEDSWQLSQVLQYGKLKWVPNYGPVEC